MSKSDLSNLATLPSVIKLAVENRLKELHTAGPGIIVSFDADEQLATVQPAIRRIFKTSTAEEEILIPRDLPVLINVPVVFPRGGGFSLTFPVAVGDECLIVFCERAYDMWHQFGGVQTPNARRFHSYSDATCLVGLSSKPNKIPGYSSTDVQLKKDDGAVSVTLKADGGLELVASSAVDVTAPEVNITSTEVNIIATDIKLTGNVLVTGNLGITGTAQNDGVDIGKTHTHTQANDSGGNSEANTGAPI